MHLLFSSFVRLPLAAALCLSLLACGGDDDDHNESLPPVAAPGDPSGTPGTGTPGGPPSSDPPPGESTPGNPAPVDPAPETPEDGPHLGAAPGDVLRVTIDTLHPTQMAVGMDQIYYHLARKQPDLGRFAPTSLGYLGDDDNDNYSRYLYRSERKRGDDYCADNGQGGLDERAYQPHTLRLIDPNTFACLDAPPQKGSDAAATLKTVVIGPRGRLYLTDGHHTFTTLNELADGGPSLPVWVRVVANFSDAADMPAFWARMAQAGYVWLRDADDRPITPDALPKHVALAHFQDDRYRSLVYLTRDLGYSNENVSEFAEFSWGSWLRAQGLDLNAYALTDLTRSRITVSDNGVAPRAGDSTTSLVAAVRDAALLMVSTDAQTPIGTGRTASDLGQRPPPDSASDWNDVLEDEVWRSDTNSSGRIRTAGKGWYAVKYRQCNGPAATQPACWLQRDPQSGSSLPVQ